MINYHQLKILKVRIHIKPVQFFPTNPYDPDAGITNIILNLDEHNKKQMFTEEKDIIEDNMIVEFR